MNIQLEDGFELVPNNPDCIDVTFSSSGSNFDIGSDERGKVYLFNRGDSPASFIEYVRTDSDKIRGNHIHKNSTETLNVISGEVHMYLLCPEKKHVFMQSLKQGEALTIPAGIAHALYSKEKSDCIVFFDKDPTHDRLRIPLLKF